MIRTLFLALLLLPFPLFAQGEMIAYAKPMQPIQVDGNSEDWPKEQAAIIEFKGTEDMQARLQLGYNLAEQSIYFLIKVTDSDYQFDAERPWYQNDNVVLYFDPIHSEKAPTCAMLILDEEGPNFSQPDEAHQVLKKEQVEVVISRKGNQRWYEGRIRLEGYLQPFRTIGFDMMVVDMDEAENTVYSAWVPGSRKEYLSGQLGHLVLLDNTVEDFGVLTGKVAWETILSEDLPDKIKIRSKQYPNIWVQTSVDSTGAFSCWLPVGEYALASNYKITSPRAGHGYFNQVRLDANKELSFSIQANQTTNIGTFKIPSFKFPSYLLEQQGVLHDFTSSDKAKVDHFIHTICSYYNIPGASVALIKDSKVVYTNSFGVENLLTQQPVSETTVFQAASVTKAVFAYLALRLVEQGVLALDQPLYQYLAFENIAHDPHYKKLTARHILSHQSGLPNWAFGGPGRANNGTKTDLQFEPGTQYGYSGEGFEYLARVVEHLTQKNLNQLLQEEVVDALDIPPLNFCDDGTLQQARGHYMDGLPTYFGKPSAPGVAHAMLTNAPTFAQFVAALSAKKGLSPKMYTDLQQQISYSKDFESPENLYWDLGVSLGFFVQETPFGKAILHGGNNGDFQAEFVLYTEKEMGFVVFANANTGHKLAQHLGKYLMYGSHSQDFPKKE